jgi:hypothetical protein
VRSGLWGAGEGCCDNDTHHRRGLLVVDGNQVVPQRFAIDCMRLDEATSGLGRRPGPFVQLPQLRSAPDCRRCWKSGRGPRRLRGSNAAGQSNTAAIRGLPGNHVTLRVGPGIYLLYAHMKPGSVPGPRRTARSPWPGVGKTRQQRQLGHATPPPPGPDHAHLRRRRPAVRLQTLPVPGPDHQPGPLGRDPRPAVQQAAALRPSQ